MKRDPARSLLLASIAVLALAYGVTETRLAAGPLGEVEIYVTDRAAAPLDSVAVQLLSAAGALVDEARTGQFGEHGHTSFIAPEGAYQVRVIEQNGTGATGEVAYAGAVTVRHWEPVRLRVSLAPR